MPSTQPRYPSEEVARRAKEIYARIKPQVDPGNVGKILAIDIKTGEWELNQDEIAVVDRLFARVPDPQVYCIRIGYRTVHHFGCRSSRIVE